MPFILIKGRFKPEARIPDGDSVRFLASNPALRKKLDDTPVRLGTSDKSKNIIQALSLENIKAIKTTTSKPNWFLTPFLSADDLVLNTRAVEKSTSFQELSHTLFVQSLKSSRAYPSRSARITHSPSNPCFQLPKCTIARPDPESFSCFSRKETLNV